MATIAVRKMEERDLALDLREADAAECIAAGMSTEQALALGAEGLYAYAVDIDGEPVAFWGYHSNSLFDTTAYAWLLTRPTIENHKFRFARTSQRLIEHIHENYEHIMCIVDNRHRLALKWLRWLGFLPADASAPLGFTWMRRSR